MSLKAIYSIILQSFSIRKKTRRNTRNIKVGVLMW